jgi:enamine deaminase RidA (YjgF/YER057c/UK114 family)
MGWEQVFRIKSYHVSIDNEAIETTVHNLRKYMLNHKPVWTCIGVTGLAEDCMKVEIEVVAHDPK